MTDKEIIKALERCRDAIHNAASCKECPYYEKENCSVISANDILDLINRQQEQLEAAIAGQETLQKALAEKDREIERLTADYLRGKGDTE